MLVQATRAVSNVSLRAAFYVGLFMFVVGAQIGVTSALRFMGVGAGLALLASGAVVLALVLGAHHGVNAARGWRKAVRLRKASDAGLPEGPCCLVWRPQPDWETPLQWKLAEPIRAPYPRLARRQGVEGMAVIAFEIGSDGKARHLHCVDVWPHQCFYDAAATALMEAQFEPKRGVKPRMGEPYRLPFVFRIAGAAKLREEGAHARPHRPALKAAQQAVDRIRRAA